jgi:hypothetical protein
MREDEYLVTSGCPISSLSVGEPSWWTLIGRSWSAVNGSFAISSASVSLLGNCRFGRTA